MKGVGLRLSRDHSQYLLQLVHDPIEGTELTMDRQWRFRIMLGGHPTETVVITV